MQSRHSDEAERLPVTAACEPCSHSPHSSIHRHSPTHWHPQGTAQVWGNTESSSITPNHVSTLLPRPISIFFFHLHSSSLDYFHPCPPLYSTSPTFMQLSLSPPTLLPASSFCQLTALNTCHLIHSPNVPLFLLSWTSCVLFLLTNIFWLSLIHILFSPLCCLATVCGPANNSMRDVYILRVCVGSMCVWKEDSRETVCVCFHGTRGFRCNCSWSRNQIADEPVNTCLTGDTLNRGD